MRTAGSMKDRRIKGFSQPTISSRMKTLRSEENTCNNASCSDVPAYCKVEEAFKKDKETDEQETKERYDQQEGERQERIRQLLIHSMNQAEVATNEGQNREESVKSPLRRRLYRTLSSQKKLQSTVPLRNTSSQNSFHSFKRLQESPEISSHNETFQDNSTSMQLKLKKTDFDLSLKAVSENKSEILVKKRLLNQKYLAQNPTKRAYSRTKPINSSINSMPINKYDSQTIEKENKMYEKPQNEDENKNYLKGEEKSSSWSEGSVVHERAKKAPSYRILNRISTNNSSVRFEGEKKEDLENRKEVKVSENVYQHKKKTSFTQKYYSTDKGRKCDKVENILIDENEEKKAQNLVSDVEDDSNKEDQILKVKKEVSDKNVNIGQNVSADKKSSKNKEMSIKIETKLPQKQVDTTTVASSKMILYKKEGVEKEISEKIENIEKWLDTTLSPAFTPDQPTAVKRDVKKKDEAFKNVSEAAYDDNVTFTKAPCILLGDEENTNPADKPSVCPEPKRKEVVQKGKERPEKVEKLKESIEKKEVLESQSKVVALASHSFTFEDTNKQSDVFTFSPIKPSESRKNDVFPSKTIQPSKERTISKKLSKPQKHSTTFSSSSRDACSEVEADSSSTSDAKETARSPQKAFNRSKSHELYSFNKNRFFKPLSVAVDGLTQKAIKFSEISSNRSACKAHETLQRNETATEDSSFHNCVSEKSSSHKMSAQHTKKGVKHRSTNSKAFKSTLKNDIGSISKASVRKQKGTKQNMHKLENTNAHFSCLDKNNNQKRSSDRSSSDAAPSDEEKSDGLMSIFKKIRSGNITPRSSFKCLENLFVQNKVTSNQTTDQAHHKHFVKPYQQPQEQHVTDRIRFQEVNVDDNYVNNNVSKKIKENMQKLKGPSKKNQTGETVDQNIPTAFDPVGVLYNNTLVYSTPCVPLEEQYDSFNLQNCPFDMQLPHPLPLLPQQEHLCCWTLQPLPVQLLEEPDLGNHYNNPNSSLEEFPSINQQNFFFSDTFLDTSLDSGAYMEDNGFEHWSVVPPCEEEGSWSHGWLEKERLHDINNSNPINYPISIEQTFPMMPEFSQSICDVNNTRTNDMSIVHSLTEQTGKNDNHASIPEQTSNSYLDFKQLYEVVPRRRRRDHRVTFSSLSQIVNSSYPLPHKGNSTYSYESSFEEFLEHKARLKSYPSIPSCRTSVLSNNFNPRSGIGEKKPLSHNGFAFGDHKDYRPVKKQSLKESRRRLNVSGSCLSISTIKTSDSHEDASIIMNDASQLEVERRPLRTL